MVDDLSTGSLANLTDARTAAGHQLTVHQMDVRSAEVVDLMARRRPEVVFHLAAQADVRVSVADPVFDADVNVIGTLRVLEGARAAHADRVVFAASGGTLYGEPEASELPLKESLPQRPLSPYGVSKKAAIDYLVAYRELHSLEFAALALANVYGPRQDPHGEAGVVAIFAERLVTGQPITIFGDGEQTRDFVYVDDVVDAFVRAATKGAGWCATSAPAGRPRSTSSSARWRPRPAWRPSPIFQPAAARRAAAEQPSTPAGPASSWAGSRGPSSGPGPPPCWSSSGDAWPARAPAGRPEAASTGRRGPPCAGPGRPSALVWWCPGARSWRQAIPPRRIPASLPVARKHPHAPLAALLRLPRRTHRHRRGPRPQVDHRTVPHPVHDHPRRPGRPGRLREGPDRLGQDPGLRHRCRGPADRQAVPPEASAGAGAHPHP